MTDPSPTRIPRYQPVDPPRWARYSPGRTVTLVAGVLLLGLVVWGLVAWIGGVR